MLKLEQKMLYFQPLGIQVQKPFMNRNKIVVNYLV